MDEVIARLLSSARKKTSEGATRLDVARFLLAEGATLHEATKVVIALFDDVSSFAAAHEILQLDSEWRSRIEANERTVFDLLDKLADEDGT